MQLAGAESLAGRQDDALQRPPQALQRIETQLGAGCLAVRQARVVLGEVLARRGRGVDEARLAFAMELARAQLTEGRAHAATDPRDDAPSLLDVAVATLAAMRAPPSPRLLQARLARAALAP